jgi:hypothetical protein
MVLRGRDGVSIVIRITRQCGDRQCLIAALLVDAEEADRRFREQSVDRGLHVGSHVSGKLPRGCGQLVRCDAGEMPIQSFVGVGELLYLEDAGRIAGDGQHAVVADECRFVGEIDLVLCDEDAA